MTHLHQKLNPLTPKVKINMTLSFDCYKIYLIGWCKLVVVTYGMIRYDRIKITGIISIYLKAFRNRVSMHCHYAYKRKNYGHKHTYRCI